MKPEISLCMIVKDCDKELDKCLSSCSDLFEEIIIVNTGTPNDLTEQVAKKYTDKIFYFAWIDDFAAARNFSLSKATKPWVAWLDSDDFIEEIDKDKIRKLDYENNKMFLLKYHYSHDTYGKPELTQFRERIWRRDLNLKFIGQIHENVLMIPGFLRVDAAIHHYKQHSSTDRNIRILKNVVTKNPSDHRNIYYLAKELFGSENVLEAKYFYKKFIKFKNTFYEDKLAALEDLATIALKENQEDNFKKYVYESLQLEECRQEPYYLLAEYYFSKKKYHNAIHFYEICVNTKRNPDLLGSFLPRYIYNAQLQLVVCYNALGNIQKAYEANEKYLEFRPNNQIGLQNRDILHNAIFAKKDGQYKKLNLGCGNAKKEGYTNCDIFKTDVCDEIFSSDKIPYIDKTISAIWSSHSLEHAGHELAKKTVKEFSRVLKPGGELQLFIPDLDLCCKAYIEANNDKIVNGFKEKDWYKMTIFGAQFDANGTDAKFQYHQTGFCKQEIKTLLEENEFVIDYCENYDGYSTPSIGIRAIKKVSDLKFGWICAENYEVGPTRIRVLNVNRALRSWGYQSELVSYNDIINKNYDVAIVGKNFDEDHYKNIKMLKQHGKVVYCDLCESLFEFQWVKEIIQICDKIICCSLKLAEQTRQYNKNVIIIEDAYET